MFPSNQLVSSVVFAGILFAAAPAPGQQEQPAQPPITAEIPARHIRHVPAPVEMESLGLFSHHAGPAPLQAQLEFRPASQMNSADQDLVANAEATIHEKAGMQNLEFNEGAWRYEQIVCPALPNHLFLRFSRDDGTRQMSMFSAAIPRGAEGKTRIIPIVRRGYSLFSPAPINALTIAAFNRIRADEQYQASPDWVGTALCYAALAGASPLAGNPLIDGSARNLVAPPRLHLFQNGRSVISFTDIAPERRVMAWSMTFDRKGRLIKATHVGSEPLLERKVAGIADPAGE